MTEHPTEEARREPLLIGSMRRAKPDAEVRIVNGSGTTVRGFLAEFDEYVAERVAQALHDAAEALNSEGLDFKEGGWGSNPADQQTIDVMVKAVQWLRARADQSRFRPAAPSEGGES